MTFTETLENRAYIDVKRRINSSSTEKFNEEMSSIKWRIDSYSRFGGISNSQRTELLNMLFGRAIDYHNAQANEEILEKKGIMRAFKSSHPVYSN